MSDERSEVDAKLRENSRGGSRSTDEFSFTPPHVIFHLCRRSPGSSTHLDICVFTSREDAVSKGRWCHIFFLTWVVFVIMQNSF